MTRLGQFTTYSPYGYNPYGGGYSYPTSYPTPYAYGYNYSPDVEPYAPVAYNEYDASGWLSPIDPSEEPDTPIPGFNGLGQLVPGLPNWALVVGAAALYWFVLRKKR